MDKNKLLLPISILLGSIILWYFFYIIQISKQESIEKQQEIKLQIDNHELEMKDRREREEKKFTNNLKCQTLLKDLKQRWNNVVGIYYSEQQNTCIVKYMEKWLTEEAPIEDMEDTN